MKLALTLSLAALVGSCQSSGASPELLPTLARSRAALDLGSYSLGRVGLLPPLGSVGDEAANLQAALGFELTRQMPFEVVTLDAEDLAELRLDQPHARGRYTPQTILAIAHRFRLDGLIVGTVTHLEPFAPQSLGIALELVAVDTGLVVWSSKIDVDTSEVRVRDALEAYQAARTAGGDSADDLSVLMLSPTSLMRFAASEMARTFEAN
ncbi:MAG: hypothetical protein FJ298_08530 [Planctomycetes bacterium]|nr:hypothetical protein [Planctomycetota bacterium]